MISKVELSNIAAFDSRGLIPIHEDLIKERMKLDLEMSNFLHKHEDTMSFDSEYYKDVWVEYKQMGKTYSELVQLLTLTEFYMKRYSL